MRIIIALEEMKEFIYIKCLEYCHIVNTMKALVTNESHIQ